MKPFIVDEIRKFVFDGFAEWHGDRYILLREKETGATTVPGYENEGWRFRVKALDFQKDWNAEDAWLEYDCKVLAFKADRITRDVTGFPELVQDRTFVNRMLYPDAESGVPRDFEVVDLPSVEHSVYRLRSAFGHLVICPRKAMELIASNRDVNLGDVVSARIQVLDDGKLRFAPADKVASAAPEASVAEGKEFPVYKPNALGESVDLEYKSSMVYVAANTGEEPHPDIAEQLGWRIMKVLASFMNTKGGTLYIGVRDNGEVSGIERDLTMMTDAVVSDDGVPRKYPATQDGFQRIVADMVSYKLGSAAAALVTSCKLMSTESGHLVGCVEVKANPLAVPVYVANTSLCMRVGSTTRTLRGEEAAKFVLQRNVELQSKVVAAIPVVPTAKTVQAIQKTLVDVSDKKSESVVKAIVSAVGREAVSGYVTIHTDGTAERGSRMLAGEGVLCSLPVLKDQVKKSGRLLLCYANGCVNVLSMKEVLRDKLAAANKRYKNGVNCESSLLAAFACSAEDCLKIMTRDAAGMTYEKAVKIADYTPHGGTSMHTKGNMVVRLANALVVSEYGLVKSDDAESVRSILMKKSDYRASL